MKITVVTISYNAKVEIERTIHSVVNQRLADFEYIVVDGASTDGTVDIIRKYQNIITKWISEPDTGIYNAMNKGIDMATGDYCIFMNAGDVFANNNVLYQIDSFLKLGYDIYNGNAFYVKNREVLWYRKCHKDVSLSYFYRSSICHQATFIKTDLLKSLHYDEGFRMVSDWKFWIQTLCKGGASYLPVDVDVCCFDMTGLTNTNRERGLKERNVVLQELLTEEERNHCEVIICKNRKRFYRNKYLSIQRNLWLLYARIFKKRQILKATRS